MAKQQQQGSVGSTLGAQDGYLFIRGLEDNHLQKYLDEYHAEIVGYRQNPGEICTNVSMKIVFIDCHSEGNANLWAFFIAKAAHPTCSKPRISVQADVDSYKAFVTWPIWNTVKHIESKQQGSRNDW